MTNLTNLINNKEKKLNTSGSKVDNVKILSEFTKKEIEKSYNLERVKGTEAYFSNRYGWTLRKTSN